MTNKEAIEYFHRTLNDLCEKCKFVDSIGAHDICNYCKENNPCKIAAEAIKKQISKKPKETDDFPHRVHCPDCDFTFGFYKENKDEISMMHIFSYCPYCGQRIDWSDNE